MKTKTVTIFLASVAVCGIAAMYRFHDSAHAMGMLKKRGGPVRHAALLDRERDSWVMIATAGVVPPFRGNARVALEGDSTLEAEFHNSEPVVNLGVHHRPKFRGNTYYDLRPGDRIALWVKISRKSGKGEQGMPVEARAPGAGLTFVDTATGSRLLSIPIRFIGTGGDGHGE